MIAKHSINIEYKDLATPSTSLFDFIYAFFAKLVSIHLNILRFHLSSSSRFWEWLAIFSHYGDTIALFFLSFLMIGLGAFLLNWVLNVFGVSSSDIKTQGAKLIDDFFVIIKNVSIRVKSFFL